MSFGAVEWQAKVPVLVKQLEAFLSEYTPQPSSVSPWQHVLIETYCFLCASRQRPHRLSSSPAGINGIPTSRFQKRIAKTSSVNQIEMSRSTKSQRMRMSVRVSLRTVKCAASREGGCWVTCESCSGRRGEWKQAASKEEDACGRDNEYVFVIVQASSRPSRLSIAIQDRHQYVRGPFSYLTAVTCSRSGSF